MLGPLYGAAIVNTVSWRWIFWLNLPFAAICLVVAFRGLARNDQPDRRLDLPGAALIGCTIGALIGGLSHEEIAVAGLDLRPEMLVVSLVLLVAFVAREARTTQPLIDLRLSARRAFSAATGGAFLLGVALIVAMVDVPLYAATVLNLSPAEGGLLLMRMTAFIPVGAIAGGALGQRIGFGAPTVGGFVTGSLGLVAMSQWGTTPTSGVEWLALAVAGTGFGLLIAPLTTAVVDVSGVERAASAASTFTVARLSGMTVGLSVLTSWGLRRFDDLAGTIQLPLPAVGESAADYQNRLVTFNQALIAAGSEVYHEIFLATALVCGVGIAVGVLLWTTDRRDFNPTASERP